MEIVQLRSLNIRSASKQIKVTPFVMESINSLEVQWDKLRFTKEEEEQIILGVEIFVANRAREKRSLIWKVCVDKNIGKEVIKTTVGRYSLRWERTFSLSLL